MARKSNMAHQFSRIPKAEIQRSSFNRSHGFKTTFNGGFLVPVFVDEALPGDTFRLNMQGFARMATPIHPYMDNVFCNSFFFAVPIRLIWENWQKFNGEQDNPGDSTDFLIPQTEAPAGGYAIGSLSDYFGIPTGVAALKHSALWHRAYNLIWNEWFRDENLQSSLTVSKGDGPDASTLYTLQRRGKRHDYFTSCLPFPQKGFSVPLPLTGDAPVKGIGITTGATFDAGPKSITETGGASVNYDWHVVTTAGDKIHMEGTAMAGAPTIRADLSAVTAATINELRQAVQIQRLFERDARGGTRYTEVVLAHFGVSSPDSRLQRPEYLGGGQSMVNVTAVAQTQETIGGGTPQGNLAAYATFGLNGHGFTKSFTEHCVLIGMISVRADINYQQGLNRMWSRETRFDFFWPALAHLGEQGVLNKEIYADATAADDDVFGYQERNAEYRYKPSVITGLFRSSAAQSLDTWHLAQDFSSRPTLSSTFIEDNPPIERVIAVTAEPHFIFDSFFDLRCARPMPLYGVPGMMDHF